MYLMVKDRNKHTRTLTPQPQTHVLHNFHQERKAKIYWLSIYIIVNQEIEEWGKMISDAQENLEFSVVGYQSL